MKHGDLTREPERTIYDYSFAWEGERETVHELGDATIREIPVPWLGVHAMGVHLNFDEDGMPARLNEVMQQAEAGDKRVLWLVGPSSQPGDLGNYLTERGLQAAVIWDGMVLEDLWQQPTMNPDLVIEPVSHENVESFAALRAHGAEPEVYAERLASSRRYLDQADKQCLMYVARLGNTPAGYVIMRVEPDGVAYFRDAFTHPDVRKHGVYSSLVAHRLQVAREAGCTAAVVQANQKTSSPILQKHGWKPVSRIEGYARPSGGEGEGW